MSKTLWKQARRPSLSDPPRDLVYDLYENYDFRIPRTCSLPWTDEQIVELPDPRSFRAMNRAGLLLCAAGLGSRETLAPFLADDPFSVGLYCAMQDGPDDYKSAKQMAHTPPEDFARLYKFFRSSKQFLREVGSIQGSILGIFLGIQGPLYNFTHSRWACLHALEQAEADLESGAVRAALVGSAFSFEDPLLTMGVRRGIPRTSILCEGAGVLVLTRAEHPTDWRMILPHDNSRCYGTAHELVLLASCDDTPGATPHNISSPSEAYALAGK